MNDTDFNTALFGYLVYSMEVAEFSRRDIDRMMRIIDRNGFDSMTIEGAIKYMKDVWSGAVNINDTDNRRDRILEKHDDLILK